MWDGLLDLIFSALKTFWCWMLQFFFDMLEPLVTAIELLLPEIDVPDFMQGGMSALDSALQGLNWVFPLGLIGFLLTGMLTYYFVLFVAVPVYRAIMDLL